VCHHDRTVAGLPIAWTRQVTVTATHIHSQAKRIFCGVDVSSQLLDAQVGRAGARGRFANDGEGIEKLAAFCRSHSVDVVVMEATGGYERLSFGLLSQAGIGVAIVNARGVRRFAQAMHIFEKTDRIDAGVIAWYGETKKVVAVAPGSEAQQRLQACVTRLRQLTETRQTQRNQRRLVTDSRVLNSIHQLLVLINKQIKALELDIAELISSDPLWQRLDKSFRSIKGVADRTVARLMAELPEIGTLSNKKISKLVGLAPLADDSGKHKGKRRIYGGRQNVRNILYIIVTCVRQHNPDFAAFHERLLKAGKAKKVVRIALAHKLLVRLNAKATDVRNPLSSHAKAAVLVG
jgi:transposase